MWCVVCGVWCADVRLVRAAGLLYVFDGGGRRRMRAVLSYQRIMFYWRLACTCTAGELVGVKFRRLTTSTLPEAADKKALLKELVTMLISVRDGYSDKMSKSVWLVLTLWRNLGSLRFAPALLFLQGDVPLFLWPPACATARFPTTWLPGARSISTIPLVGWFHRLQRSLKSRSFSARSRGEVSRCFRVVAAKLCPRPTGRALSHQHYHPIYHHLCGPHTIVRVNLWHHSCLLRSCFTIRSRLP